MTLRDFYLKRAKAEFPVFLKVLRALPSDLSYKPDERSPSAEQLVWTLTYELKALIDVVDTGKSEWENITPPGLDEMIGMFEKWSTEILDKVVREFAGSFSAEHGIGPYNHYYYDRYTSEAVRSVSVSLAKMLMPQGCGEG